MKDSSHAPAVPDRLTVDEALTLFAGLSTLPEQRHDALTVLISAKFLPKQADRPEVIAGIQCWIDLASKADEPGHRLLAIAECTRLAQVIRRIGPDLAKRLRPAFDSQLPSPQLLTDADDRLNLARACAQVDAPWLPDYLAHAVAGEEAGEKARAELVATLLARSPTIADALSRLVSAFEALRPRTESPGDTVARRMTRTLATLRAALLECELGAGENLGKALRGLVADTFGEVGRPSEEKVRIELSREALLAVHDIVRTRLSVAADSDIYSVVAYCRNLCGGSIWPPELAKPLDRLLADVTEALVLLGRQGQCAQGLRDQLKVLCSHPERAQVIARDLAESHPELPEDVRDWLVRGRPRTPRAVSESAAELSASRADESIGLALHACRQLQQAGANLRLPLTASLELYEPALGVLASDLLDRVQVVAVQVEQAAGMRGLALYGTPGDEVDFSPKHFDAVGGVTRPRMVVRQPAIVRRRTDGSLGDVVTRGLVE